MYLKHGALGLETLEDFKDDFIFDFKYTKKHLLMYADDQDEIELEDYQGKRCKIKDKSGCCLVPTTYVLGKSLDYVKLITDNSSKRARYKE